MLVAYDLTTSRQLDVWRKMVGDVQSEQDGLPNIKMCMEHKIILNSTLKVGQII